MPDSAVATFNADSSATSKVRFRLCWAYQSLVVVAAAVGLIVVGGLSAVAYDRATAGRFLPGVTVGGIDVGSQSAAEVVRRAEDQLLVMGARTLRLDAGQAQATATLAELGLRSNVAKVVAQAQDDARAMGTVSRLWHRLSHRSVGADYPVLRTVDRSKVAGLLSGLAHKVDRDPLDARIDTSTGLVRIIPAVAGQALDQEAGLKTAMSSVETMTASEASPQTADVKVPLIVRPPAVTGYADVILIRLGENRLYHYEHGALTKTYVVATGTSRYPTPRGRFVVTLKRRNPTWINPDPGGWGRSLPPRILPGPGNPLGTRALNLSAPGIRIHGTSNVASLGRSASHGCIRMSIAESEELFERVGTGTPVVIISGQRLSQPGSVTPMTTIGDPNAPVDLEAG